MDGGIRTGVTLALVFGFFLWYTSRPKPPKPWNSSAITATYDSVSTEGDKNTLVFIYTLENRTNFDYRADDGQNITMNARLVRHNSLSPFAANPDFSKIDYPIFVPAQKRLRFLIHLSYPYSVKEKPNADNEERKRYREGLEKYVASEFQNLNGFELLDTANRYDVVFEAGWNKSH